MNISRDRNMLKIFSCEECGNSYTRNRTLQNHLLNKHPTKHIQRTFKFKCDMCNYQFNFKRNLDYHKRKVHNINKSEVELQCPLCEHIATTTYKLNGHFKSQHELEIQIQNLTFLSFSEFLNWKKEMEAETKSTFIRKRFIKTGELTNHYFDCNRSGHYVPRGEGKRYLKAIGSKKINGVCPAHMIVRESNDGKCTVTFTETHVGHKADLGHLYLTKSERKKLALKIQQKIPFDTILDEARVSVYETNLQRIHLLTKKDLHNIRQRCNLSSSRFDKKN